MWHSFKNSMEVVCNVKWRMLCIIRNTSKLAAKTKYYYCLRHFKLHIYLDISDMFRDKYGEPISDIQTQSHFYDEFSQFVRCISPETSWKRLLPLRFSVKGKMNDIMFKTQSIHSIQPKLILASMTMSGIESWQQR